jgi:hypothetical protein
MQIVPLGASVGGHKGPASAVPNDGYLRTHPPDLGWVTERDPTLGRACRPSAEYLQVRSRLADLTRVQVILFCRWASGWPGRSCQWPEGRCSPEAARGGAPMTAPAWARAVGSRWDLTRLATVVTASTTAITISDTAVVISGTRGSKP